MEELIKISKGHNGKGAVNARELHLFLESRQNFSNWIKDRIEKYDFIEGVEYVRILLDFRGNKIIDTDVQQVHKIEYAITLDMAKELSMVEGNDKGKQARKYFIKREKEAIELSKPKELSRKELALMVIESENARELAELKIKELEPKVEVYEHIANAENILDLNKASKSLGIGRNTLMKLLREDKVLRKDNTPYQQYIDQNYFEVKIKSISFGKTDSNYTQTFVTSKGLIWLSKKIREILVS
jgi:anti-repressor protein